MRVLGHVERLLRTEAFAFAAWSAQLLRHFLILAASFPNVVSRGGGGEQCYLPLVHCAQGVAGRVLLRAEVREAESVKEARPQKHHECGHQFNTYDEVSMIH